MSLLKRLQDKDPERYGEPETEQETDQLQADIDPRQPVESPFTRRAKAGELPTKSIDSPFGGRE